MVSCDYDSRCSVNRGLSGHWPDNGVCVPSAEDRVNRHFRKIQNMENDTEPLSKRLDIRCSESQLSRWSALAKRDGRDLANWVRYHLDRAAKNATTKNIEHDAKLPQKGE